ncbi:MAG: hypothetical protein KA123_02660 [Candidatus Eisenbacteria bacterium]|nr:hypothetical protein [Candidatus Eisenbacteria bacterium]
MSDSPVAGRIWRVRALSRRAVGREIFELEIERPESFAFLPGQHIRLRSEEGARDYSLERAELDLASALRPRARLFVPCLSRACGDAAGGEGETELRGGYAGRVTRYMERELPAGRYDFYLCGAAEMIQEAIVIADARFPQSRVFAEAFD